MLIDCPGCTKSYHISRAILEPNGRTVVCPRCNEGWFITAEHAENAAPRVPYLEISAEAVSQRAIVPMAKLPQRRRDVPAWPQHLKVSGLFLAGFAGVGLLMAALGLSHSIVRLWPQAASAYAAIGLPVNLRGLAVHDVRLIETDAPGEAALEVQGQITNLKPGINAVPALRLSLRDAQGREIYMWTTTAAKAHVSGGETLAFNARLASPPVGATSVLVSFAPAARESLVLAR
jgi:predicted Zn finger-like uncharacterized protein